MNKRAAICVSTVFVSLASVVLVAAPANAADTPVTVQIDGGVLSISAPVALVAATPITAGVAAQTVAIALGDVTVTDNVGGTAGWAASVVATQFTSANGTLPLTSGSYATGAVTTTGTVTVTPAPSAAVTTAATIAAGTAVSGVNTAAWNPTVTVAIPEGALAGTYASTVTHSVL
jgi:hypothetical protein